MTGNEIVVMRRILDFTRAEFGGVIGASDSAVRRWEAAGESAARLEPRYEELIVVLREELDRDPDRVKFALGEVRRQGIRALHALLTLHYGPAKVEPDAPVVPVPQVW